MPNLRYKMVTDVVQKAKFVIDSRTENRTKTTMKGVTKRLD